jgi:single-strand DNA-binding protein
MNGLNRVIIVGTVGSPLKLLQTKDGKPYTSLNLATNRYWRNREGKNERRTDWHKVFVWGRKGEMCFQNLGKGSFVCVEGYLSTYETTEEDGKRRWHTTINAVDVNFMGRTGTTEIVDRESGEVLNESSTESQDAGSAFLQPTHSNPLAATGSEDATAADDIPF